jgi:hypothetical protein
MQKLKSKFLNKQSTLTLFGIQMILGEPKIETRQRFIKSLKNRKISNEESLKINNLLQKMASPDLKENDVIIASGYYSNTMIVKAQFKARIISISNGKIFARVKELINPTHMSPAITSTVTVPISMSKKV